MTIAKAVNQVESYWRSGMSYREALRQVLENASILSTEPQRSGDTGTEPSPSPQTGSLKVRALAVGTILPSIKRLNSGGLPPVDPPKRQAIRKAARPRQASPTKPLLDGQGSRAADF